MRTEEERLFAPGTGALPPLLAGREREQRVLSQCLSDLKAGGSPPHDVVLICPRGNGKTVLLRWFENACHEVSVNVLRVVPGRVGDYQALVEALLPAGRLHRWLPKNASFWDRLGRGLLGIGRLSDAAAKEALTAPLSGHGVRIDADALDGVIARSQCYAYFVQLWAKRFGSNAWRRARRT